MNQDRSVYYRISSFVGKSIIKAIEWTIGLVVYDSPVPDTKKFAWTELLEKDYHLIREEYLAISGQDLASDITEISIEQKKVVKDTKWKFFPLYVYGVPIDANIALCPETNRLLHQIPNFTTAFFSILTPDTIVEEHRGAYKGYLRFHLGVDIPDDYQNCGIRILNKTYHWQNAKSFIFDDTYLHDAWNKSSQSRVVLYVDFIRPMPAPLVWISRRLTQLIGISPYIQGALKNLKEKGNAKAVGKILS